MWHEANLGAHSAIRQAVRDSAMQLIQLGKQGAHIPRLWVAVAGQRFSCRSAQNGGSARVISGGVRRPASHRWRRRLRVSSDAALTGPACRRPGGRPGRYRRRHRPVMPVLRQLRRLSRDHLLGPVAAIGTDLPARQRGHQQPEPDRLILAPGPARAAVGPAPVRDESPHDPHIARRPLTRALVLLG
jgi:hypothetical protein